MAVCKSRGDLDSILSQGKWAKTESTSKHNCYSFEHKTIGKYKITVSLGDSHKVTVSAAGSTFHNDTNAQEIKSHLEAKTDLSGYIIICLKGSKVTKPEALIVQPTQPESEAVQKPKPCRIFSTKDGRCYNKYDVISKKLKDAVKKIKDKAGCQNVTESEVETALLENDDITIRLADCIDIPEEVVVDLAHVLQTKEEEVSSVSETATAVSSNRQLKDVDDVFQYIKSKGWLRSKSHNDLTIGPIKAYLISRPGEIERFNNSQGLHQKELVFKDFVFKVKLLGIIDKIHGLGGCYKEMDDGLLTQILTEDTYIYDNLKDSSFINACIQDQIFIAYTNKLIIGLIDKIHDLGGCYKEMDDGLLTRILTKDKYIFKLVKESSVIGSYVKNQILIAYNGLVKATQK